MASGRWSSRQGSSVSFLLPHQDLSRVTVCGPASAAPVHHAICTPTMSTPARAAFCPTVSGRNGIANRENHNMPESRISATPILAAGLPLSRPRSGRSLVESRCESEFVIIRPASRRQLVWKAQYEPLSVSSKCRLHHRHHDSHTLNQPLTIVFLKNRC